VYITGDRDGQMLVLARHEPLRDGKTKKRAGI